VTYNLIFSTSASARLTQLVAEKSRIPRGIVALERFVDGEVSLVIKNYEAVKGANVLVIGSTFSPAENIIELLMLLDTLNMYQASSVTALIPYFGYGRSDYAYCPGAPIGARFMATLIESSGADKVIIIDLHSSNIERFFSIPLIHLSAVPLLAQTAKEIHIENLAIVSPDMGGIDRANVFAKEVGAEAVVSINKKRKAGEKVEIIDVHGSVEGRNVIIIDDMIQSGNTIVEAAHELKKRGAQHIYAALTHMLPISSTIERLVHTQEIEKIIITDTVPGTNLPSKINVVSVVPLIVQHLNL